MLAIMLDEPNRFRMTEEPAPEVQPSPVLELTAAIEAKAAGHTRDTTASAGEVGYWKRQLAGRLR